MKNGLENFKYKGCRHYKLREVCKYIVPYVISSYKLEFKLLNNISHAISATNEDQCKTSQWGRCHAFLIWAFCLVTSVSHHFVASVATVTDCDLPHLSSAIWCIQWFLVHWGISSIQNSCNWILVECPNTLSKKKWLFSDIEWQDHSNIYSVFWWMRTYSQISRDRNMLHLRNLGLL